MALKFTHSNGTPVSLRRGEAEKVQKRRKAEAVRKAKKKALQQRQKAGQQH